MDNTNAIGPGLVEELIPQGHSRIEGFDDFKYVEILNPLTVDFVGQVGLTKPMTANMPIGGANDPQSPQTTKSEQDVRQTYGFDMRSNAQQQGKMHIPTKIRIPAGQTLRLFGSEAQVIAMQLITAILQQEGHSNIADPALREMTENRIIRSTGNIREQMMTTPQSEREQLRAALDQMNDAPVNEVETNHEEVEFADANVVREDGQSSGASQSSEVGVGAPAKRIGRPPKTA